VIAPPRTWFFLTRFARFWTPSEAPRQILDFLTRGFFLSIHSFLFLGGFQFPEYILRVPSMMDLSRAAFEKARNWSHLLVNWPLFESNDPSNFKISRRRPPSLFSFPTLFLFEILVGVSRAQSLFGLLLSSNSTTPGHFLISGLLFLASRRTPSRQI